MPIPRTGKIIHYVTLRVGNIVFRILDTAALDDADELMRRAHQLCEETFEDWREYRANPTRPYWRPRPKVQFKGGRQDWLTP